MKNFYLIIQRAYTNIKSKKLKFIYIFATTNTPATTNIKVRNEIAYYILTFTAN